ncbi:MAG TPA: TetR/AcrR family transcriptional regulator [Sporichthyaceae bacterium]
MAGKKQFDEDAVLLQVRELFRHRGYGATSIDDLVRATGLSRSSLYGAYGGKAELFELVLERYQDFMVDLLAPRAGGSATERVRAVALGLLDAMEAAGHPGGCLVTNTFAESADIPEPIQASARNALVRQEEQMLGCLTGAADADRIGDAVELRRLARYFVGVRQSVCILWRAGTSRADVEQFIETSLSVLRPPRAA